MSAGAASTAAFCAFAAPKSKLTSSVWPLAAAQCSASRPWSSLHQIAAFLVLHTLPLWEQRSEALMRHIGMAADAASSSRT